MKESYFSLAKKFVWLYKNCLANYAGIDSGLSDRYVNTSNWESGYGKYGVVLEPKGQEDCSVIMEFKVRDPMEEKAWKRWHQRLCYKLKEVCGSFRKQRDCIGTDS